MTFSEYWERFCEKNGLVVSGSATRKLTITAEKFKACMEQSFCKGHEHARLSENAIKQFNDIFKKYM